MTEATPRIGYHDIVQRIRSEIARGDRASGTRLPSVRSLAATLGVNVNTVARAYAELARDGSIESRHGGGSFVRAVADDAILAERRSEQLRAIMAEAVLRSLSMGHAGEEIERAVQTQLDAWYAASGKPMTSRSAEGGTLRFAGSHDVALEILATRLRHRPSPIDLQLDFTGSTAGLMALLLDQADIAGCHLGDDADGSTVNQIQRLLPMRRLTLVTLARRQQGIMLPPGNPRGLHEIRDLAESDVRIALRQAGSGTRLLLDRALVAEGLSPQLIGHPVLTTHAEVAKAIADGTADAGLGILAAARTHGLDFIPLAWERYNLAIPGELADRPSVEAIIETIASTEFRSAIEALGGYDTAESGRREEIGEA